MGLLDSLFSNNAAPAKSLTAKAKAEKLSELETKVVSLSSDIDELKKRMSDLTEIIAVLSLSQQQLAADMSIIYENVQAVGDILAGQSKVDDEKYFSWRWNIDDDDDLPN